MSITLDSLTFDITAPDDGANVGAHVRSSDGTLITHTSLGGGEEALDVNIASGGGAGFGAHAEDVAHVSGDLGVQMLAVRNDTEGTLVDTDGDYASLQLDNLGRLRVVADIDVVNTAPNSGTNFESATVGTTAVQLVPTALTGRMTLIVQHDGKKPIRLGNDNTVSTIKGLELRKNSIFQIELGDTLEIWAISGTAAQTVQIMEIA